MSGIFKALGKLLGDAPAQPEKTRMPALAPKTRLQPMYWAEVIGAIDILNKKGRN
jgi:hypothetical protein